MTKGQYLEMCQMLNTEPVAEELPVELEDLPVEAQQALELYQNLYDKWDSMAGRYEGKDLSIFPYLLDLWKIPVNEHKVYFTLIKLIDSIRADEIRNTTLKPSN